LFLTFDPVRLGVAGLGRGFVLTLPSFRSDPRVELVAAAAPRAESRAAFEAEFGGQSYDTVEALCSDPGVEAIYVATPHQLHRDHVIAAVRAGKHVLVDKPLAVSIEDGAQMVAAAHAAGVHLIVGPSHSFDPPVALARSMIESGEFGKLRFIQALNYTDFLYRPRRPEELCTQEGGGILFSQAIHQIDVVRLLAGGLTTQVFAMTGAWDADRPTEGAASTLLRFASGVFANLTYSGYAHFDSDDWMEGIGELGGKKPPEGYGAARRALAHMTSDDETALKRTRTYGGSVAPSTPQAHEHFGPVIAVCDRADLRLTPHGVEVYGDHKRTFRPAPVTEVPRKPVIDALVDAVRQGTPPVQTGAWGLASLEICHAILASATSGQPIVPAHQVGTRPDQC
jgi:phthalate 4,5-cis-dihydrodiol dehydrogenase